MVPTINVPHFQAAPPTHAATVNAAVSAERQTHKQMQVGVDSSQKDHKAGNDKARSDQKDSFATQKAEGELSGLRRRDQREQQHTQHHHQQTKQAAPSPEKPAVSASLSYADKLSALTGMDKSLRAELEKRLDHLDTIAPHLARHGDGSVTAGLATSRLLSDLDGLMGEDIYADMPPLTNHEGSNAYSKTAATSVRLASTSDSVDLKY